jgi:RNA polymerase sigma factor FliA
MPAKALWNRYARGDNAARDALVHEHLGLVHHVARQLGRRLPAETELDELVSAGTIGLINAMSNFDVARGLSFSTFAVPRIRGAILDELRRQDHVPRSVRRRARDLHTAREALARRLGRSATDAELAAQLGVTADMLRRWERDIEGSVKVPIDRSRAQQEGSRRGRVVVELLSDGDHSSVDERLTREQEVARVRVALEELKEQERTVLALYYFEELSLTEIADVLGLSACRISQVRTAALAKLRTSLAALRAA